ncbi:Ig-like domain-containing protein [Paenibacillus massiliensis]|uniref:Ig-like domain-containing protein n=1 Tax=Paenibacillus massiliensis TaxID=225917 RepID=UPI00035DB575|nr:Ig-like domain-containing protein [Paenibacillus massiliensis]
MLKKLAVFLSALLVLTVSVNVTPGYAASVAGDEEELQQVELNIDSQALSAKEYDQQSAYEALPQDVQANSLFSYSQNNELTSETVDVNSLVAEGLDEQAVATQLRAETSVTAATYETPDNTTIGGAIQIPPGYQLQGLVTEEGQNRWYYTYVDKTNKLTVRMDPPASTSVDYSLALYKEDPATGELSFVAYSLKDAGVYEQLSYVATPGYYVILVQSNVGFDTTNPFTLSVIASDSYDSSEPDDNPWFAKDRGSAPFTSSQTIDNFLDEDWSKITITGTGSPIMIKFGNTSQYGDYKLYLYGSNLANLGVFDQNSNITGTLPAGDYYIMVSAPQKFDSTTPYTLSVSYQSADVYRVNITGVSSEESGFINYGSGNMYRVKGNTTFTGKAFDASGNPVANAQVTVKVTVRINNTVVSTTANTDSQGNFQATMRIPAAAGYSVYYNGSLSRHYYDIVPIRFESGGVNVNANISSLYHFAYSIRN